jgi:peptidoglycan/xylan/chitin deacetylase (PgdA/CDA1 family)
MARGNIPLVFMYHRISSDKVPARSRWAVTQSTFRSHLEYLVRNGYSTPRLEDIVSGAYRQRDGGKGSVLLTFDDGYLDNYENAFPLLLEFRFSALIFLVADFSRRVNWWDRSSGLGGAPLLEKHHVQEMDAAGVRFGSHTSTHREMTALSDEELRGETRGSRKVLEDLLGRAVTGFAYPYGIRDRRVVSAVQEAGYTSAFGTSDGPPGFFDDIFQIRRINMEDQSGELFMRFKCAQSAQRVVGRLASFRRRLKERMAPDGSLTRAGGTV